MTNAIRDHLGYEIYIYACSFIQMYIIGFGWFESINQFYFDSFNEVEGTLLNSR